MGRDEADQALGSQVGNGSAGERAVDAQSVDEHGRRDELVRRHLLDQAVLGVLVKDNGVVGLFLRLALGPLLLCLSCSSLWVERFSSTRLNQQERRWEQSSENRVTAKPRETQRFTAQHRKFRM